MNKSMFSNPPPHPNSHYITAHTTLTHTPFPTPATPLLALCRQTIFLPHLSSWFVETPRAYGDASTCLLRLSNMAPPEAGEVSRARFLAGPSCGAVTGRQHHRLTAQAPCRSERKLRCSLPRTWPPGINCRHLDIVAVLFKCSLFKDRSTL